MNNTFVLIDGSYFIVHRYECLNAWWKLQNKQQGSTTPDLFENVDFVKRFKELFRSNLRSLPSDLNLTSEQKENMMVIVGKDCPRANIWRNEFFPNYKGTRELNETRRKFGIMVYEEKIFEEEGVTQILNHPKLEADDCIAIATQSLIEKYGKHCSIYIITSDKDYLQLSDTNVHIYNLNFKKITDQKSSHNNPECDLFCKIVMGDKSDNIPSVIPRCGPKTALKLYNEKSAFYEKINSNEQYKAQFELNTKIIDFKNIPQGFATELKGTFTFI